MSDIHDVLARESERYVIHDGAFERMRRRRDRKRRNQRIVAGAVGLAILAAGLIVGVETIRTAPEPGATPTVAPAPLALLRQPGEVAFTTNGGVFGKNPSTGATRKLGDCSAPCELVNSFAWSPDGTAIAYVIWTCVGASSQCGPEEGLWVKQAGQQPRQLPIETPTEWRWSPDGSRIAFVAYDVERSYLSLVDPVDGSTTLLSSSANGALAWSPDGSEIAFAEGSGVSLVTPAGVVSSVAAGLGSVDSIAWSSDGSQLVVDARADHRSRIYVIRANGSSDSAPVILTDEPSSEGPGAPAWSPDGTKVAFLATPGSSGHYGVQVWVVNADGSGRIKLADSGCCVTVFDGPVWSPDGSKVAYMVTNQWYEVGPDGVAAAQSISTDVALAWRQRP